MQYDLIVEAAAESQAETGLDNPLLEVTAPANTLIDILEVTIGAHEGATAPPLPEAACSRSRAAAPRVKPDPGFCAGAVQVLSSPAP